MQSNRPPVSEIDQDFRKRFSSSAKLAEQAHAIFPSGVTHDGRYLQPFPVAVSLAAGAEKITLEGHSLIDYWVGHGSLLLGHAHPTLVSAVQAQVARGTHYAAAHELEVEWGQLVQKLIPCAQQVRFTSSGTEATLMALRLARLVTGRRKIIKFIGHFHGWHDAVMPAAYAPYATSDGSIPGVTSGVLQDVVVIEPGNLALLEQTIEVYQPAAVILEGTGGHWGQVPLNAEFLRGVRELTTRSRSLLILDEVITGFRVAPGGAQQHYSITPDLTTLAKILAGGLPGGAVTGSAEIMSALAHQNSYGKKMRHPGTYNANPLSAAAGVAMLKEIDSTNATQQATTAATALRRALNLEFQRIGANWIAYGSFSMIFVLPNYPGPRPTIAGTGEQTDDSFVPHGGDWRQLDGVASPELTHAFRCALLLEGVDWFGWGGMTSTAHTPEIISRTVAAFGRAWRRLAADGWFESPV